MEENDITCEEWLPVVGYEGLYEVSNHGRVRSLERTCGDRWGNQRRVRQRVMVLYTNRGGYLQVGLHREYRQKTRTVHRLVAAAFLGPTDAAVVRHLDGSRDNNHASNLALGSHQDNIDDRTSHGTTARGEGNARAKLTSRAVRQIRAEHASGAPMIALAERWGVTYSSICRIASRKTWKHI